MKIAAKSARVIERGLLIAGVVLLTVFLAAHVHRAVMVRAEMERFKEARLPDNGSAAAGRSATKEGKSAPAASLPGDAESAGSDSLVRPPGRAEPRESGVHPSVELPLAILRIPKLHLEVPVLNGTDSITLNRGVGRIAGTALPGEKGNVGIAGHRDGFFSGLKDISSGDQIELVTARETHTYVVGRILITDPDDMSVLEQGAKPALTLVTCYPFHYIGPAPRRFVVEASLKQ